MAGENQGKSTDVLPAAPNSCCGKFSVEVEENGQKIVKTVPPPALRSKPARELTVTEARRIVSFLVCRGDIELTLRYKEFKCKNDGSFEFTSPPLTAKRKYHEAEKDANGKPTGRRIFDATKDFIAPETVDIKSVVKLNDLSGTPTIVVNDMNQGPDPTKHICGNVDYRNIVGLYKFLEMLKKDFGATEMLHMGIGAGGGPASDCHNTGRAIDFAGVKGTTKLDPSFPSPLAYDIRVLQHWGQKKILDQSGKPAGKQQGSVFFWTDTDRPFFRLISQGVPAPTTFEDQLSINIFQAVYDFAREEYVEHSFQFGPGSSRTTAPPAVVPVTQIGQGSFILHPDAPGGSSLAHTNHMHFQIGWTGLEDKFNVAPPSSLLGNPTN